MRTSLIWLLGVFVVACVALAIIDPGALAYALLALVVLGFLTSIALAVASTGRWAEQRSHR